MILRAQNADASAQAAFTALAPWALASQADGLACGGNATRVGYTVTSGGAPLGGVQVLIGPNAPVTTGDDGNASLCVAAGGATTAVARF